MSICRQGVTYAWEDNHHVLAVAMRHFRAQWSPASAQCLINRFKVRV